VSQPDFSGTGVVAVGNGEVVGARLMISGRDRPQGRTIDLDRAHAIGFSLANPPHVREMGKYPNMPALVRENSARADVSHLAVFAHFKKTSPSVKHFTRGLMSRVQDLDSVQYPSRYRRRNSC